jgi:O-antigen ligase
MGSPLTAEVGESESQDLARDARRRRMSHTPSRALPGTWRGALWVLVVAADFVLMSNPLVFVFNFDAALRLATLITVSTVVLTFPWVRTPRVALPVVAYLGWTLASYTWSILPAYTSDAWVQSAVVASVAVFIYTNVSARVLVTGFVLGGVAVSAASLYAFHERLPGAFYAPVNEPVMAGIGTNQNILAYTLTLSLCAVFVAAPRPAWARLAWLGALGIIGYGLLEADSATGDVTTLALVFTAVLLTGYGPLTRRFIRTTTHRVMAVIATAAIVVAAYVGVKQALGQDLMTFSDRTPLWSATLVEAQDRPLTGFGWGAVWPHPWKPALLNVVLGDIWDRSGLPLSHGHNSAIDLVIEVGFVGVLLMVVVMVTVGIRSVTLMRMSGPDRVDDTIMARFIVLCLVNLVVCGITEPMATIPLGWWALVLLTEPGRPSMRWRASRRAGSGGNRRK